MQFIVVKNIQKVSLEQTTKVSHIFKFFNDFRIKSIEALILYLRIDDLYFLISQFTFINCDYRAIAKQNR